MAWTNDATGIGSTAFTASGTPADISRQFVALNGVEDADGGVDLVPCLDEDRAIWLAGDWYLTLGEPGATP